MKKNWKKQKDVAEVNINLYELESRHWWLRGLDWVQAGCKLVSRTLVYYCLGICAHLSSNLASKQITSLFLALREF